MAARDSQTVILSRQAILLVTAVGVGLLTLCYVLGVQVGKQSAALRQTQARGAGEDLQELPASVAEQLKSFEQNGTGAGFEKAQKVPAKAEAAEAKPAEAKPAEAKPAEAKPAEAKSAPEKKAESAEKKPEGPRWVLQLVSTPDESEAKRVANKAKGAGFPTQTVKDKGLLKVRLLQPGTRDAVDAAAVKLKNRGFKPFAIKVTEAP